MQRRNFLKVAGGVGIGTIGGAAFMTGGAVATQDVEFSVDDPAPVTTDDGTITFYNVSASGSFTFEGLDSPAKSADVAFEASVDGGSTFEEVDSVTLKKVNGTSGTYEFDLDGRDITELFGDETFSVGDDGGNAVTTIDLRLTVTVHYGMEKTVEDSETSQMDLDVTNRAASADANASASGEAGSYDVLLGSHSGDSTLAITDQGDAVTFVFDASDWADESASGFNVDQAAASIAINGTTGDDTADFQVGFHNSDGAFYKEAAWTEESIPSGIELSRSGEGEGYVYEAVVPKDHLGNNGDVFRVMAHASAGGEYANQYVSATPGKGYNAEGGWDGSDEHYLDVDLS